jgi:hypothetical protein
MSSLEIEILASRLSRSEVLDHNGGSCCYACWLGGGCKNCRLKAAKKALLARAEKPQEQKEPPARKQRKQRKFYKGGQFLPGGTRAPSGGCFKNN